MKTKLISFATSAVFVALLFVSACTKDKTEVFSASSCHVTVSVGFPGTKSAAAYDEANRVYTLKFTEGDRLYVHGTDVDVDEAGEWHMAGYLDMVPGSISEDGKRATFDGNLTIYNHLDDGTYQGADMVLPDYTNPLQACGATVVRLIPAGVDNSLLQQTGIDVEIKDCVVKSLEVLMSSAVDVWGNYIASKDFIVLNRSNHAIFDVNVSQLLPNTTYDVELYLGQVKSDTPDNSTKIVSGQVLSGPSGNASFAISFDIIGKAERQSGYAFLILKDESHTLRANLGSKNPFDTEKVYRASSSAE
ncbi:MAG: hypothetical protein IJK74_06785 [Bacteroidales bacterium]|nr:hypothetical protein [Bacteroidales bacterium]